jgi:hypothetical protein
MYGEPGDAFHDRYTEGNFAYRAGLRYCHSAVRLTKDESCGSIFESDCTGAFHHIGGGRGTRPMNARGSACEDFGWNFLGTVSDYLARLTSDHKATIISLYLVDANSPCTTNFTSSLNFHLVNQLRSVVLKS